MRHPSPELSPSDDELGARAGSGDRDAFGALYERHFPGLFDFAARVVRDREAAADVVQTTFTKAWIRWQRDETVRDVKGWLYTIARNAAIDEVRHRKKEVTPGDDDDGDSIFAELPADPRSDPVSVTQDRELAELVWASASALGPTDYSLLDLHVRRDLGADELAETLGLKKGAVYTRLSRLRDSLEDAVISTMLLRRGRRDCPELDRLLTTLQATELTRKVHRAIRAHRRECDRCEESRRTLVSPIAIFAGLSPIPAAVGLAEDVWSRLGSTLDGAPGGAGGGALRPVTGLARRTRLLIGAAVAMVVAASAAGVVALGGSAPPPEDPFDVRSTSHEIGVPSADPVIEMAWSAVPEASAYSIEWSEGPQDLPDAVGDLPGSATTIASPELEPGSWYFHLRTEGGGEWTSTVHVGPFVVEPSPVPEPVPELSIEDVVVQELGSGDATVVVRVALSRPSEEGVTAAYRSVDGSAAAGEDYRPVDGTLSIPPGETAGSIEVVVLSDEVDEPDETFLIELSQPVNATLADHRAEVTIVERAVRPTISIGGTSVIEGGAGSTSEVVFPLLLSTASERRVRVRWETRDETAEAGTDYSSASGTVSFPPGEVSAEVRVRVLGDDLEEPDETFAVRLSDPDGARIGDDRAVATIRDDDEPGSAPTPEVSIGDRSIVEGDSGTAALAFPVTLSGPSEEDVSVRYTIAGGSATLGADVRPGSGTVRFGAGTTSVRIEVQVVGDRIDEPDERFLVLLSAPQNAILVDGRGVGTIRDDDPPPSLSIGDMNVEEGTGANRNAQLTVRLSGPSSRRITAAFATSPGTASAGSDYVAASGTVSFPPGETVARISIPIVGDRVDEPDETFLVELSNASNATIAGGTATLTIRDDDPPPTISIRDVSAAEGTGANRVVRLTVTLSDPSAFTVRVSFDTVDGSAVAPQDYLPPRAP